MVNVSATIGALGLSDLGTDIGNMFSNLMGAMLPGIIYVAVIALIVGVFAGIVFIITRAIGGIKLGGGNKRKY